MKHREAYVAIQAVCALALLGAGLIGSSLLRAQDVVPPAPVSPAGVAAAGVPGPAEDIRTIEDPVAIFNPWPWVLGALVLVAVALAWVFFLKRRRKEKPAPGRAPPVRVDPYTEAVSQLENTRPLIQRGEDKAFSLAASDIIRRYIERQFRLPAPERTTEEFLSEIVNNPILRDKLADYLTRFLQLCDLAKFANQPFGLREMEELYETAHKFIYESSQEKRKQDAARILQQQEARRKSSAAPPKKGGPLKTPAK